MGERKGEKEKKRKWHTGVDLVDNGSIPDLAFLLILLVLVVFTEKLVL